MYIQVTALEVTNLSTYSCQDNQLCKTWNKAIPAKKPEIIK